jgi:hypothetical protein
MGRSLREPNPSLGKISEASELSADLQTSTRQRLIYLIVTSNID